MTIDLCINGMHLGPGAGSAGMRAMPMWARVREVAGKIPLTTDRSDPSHGAIHEAGAGQSPAGGESVVVSPSLHINESLCS